MPPSTAMNAATASATIFQIAASSVPLPCVKSVADAAVTVVKSLEVVLSLASTLTFTHGSSNGRECRVIGNIAMN